MNRGSLCGVEKRSVEAIRVNEFRDFEFDGPGRRLGKELLAGVHLWMLERYVERVRLPLGSSQGEMQRVHPKGSLSKEFTENKVLKMLWESFILVQLATKCCDR